MHLEQCAQQFYTSSFQPINPSHLIFRRSLSPTPASSGRLSRPHSIALSEACKLDVKDPNALLVKFGGVLEEGTYHMTRRLFSERLVWWSGRSSGHRHPTRCLFYSYNWSGPGGYVDGTLMVAQFLAGLPQFVDLPQLQMTSTPFLLNLHSRHCIAPLTHAAPAGPLHLHPPSSFSSHIISSVVWRLTLPLLSNNNNNN